MGDLFFGFGCFMFFSRFWENWGREGENLVNSRYLEVVVEGSKRRGLVGF